MASNTGANDTDSFELETDQKVLKNLHDTRAPFDIFVTSDLRESCSDFCELS